VPAPRPGLDANESASAEVTAVVDAILEHARTRPRESLGVIALGQVHAERINEALRRARPDHPDLDAFFAEPGTDDEGGGGLTEPFFVKNLERVQGDERDAIILSIGYGKRNADGRLTYHFGPILTDKGERRLNVAITRARRRLTVVSTFGAEDMDPARSDRRGVELLRRYLAYVASGGNDLGSAPLEHPKLNAFELDVRDRLVAAGIPVIAQYGVSGYSIDFVASDRDQPGRFVLAIECDGAGYHSQPTARDRDRLRQQQLERLGWRFHRIWSTDWFADPTGEVQRVVDAYEHARIPVPARPPAPAPSAVTSAAPKLRGPRPAVEPGHPISDYTLEQLVALATWIESDTLLRTEDELVEALMDDLGFQRHGKRIDERLRAAARRP
jgi:very-short-patch-repair endonuclease